MDKIGRYQVVSELGRGAMGVVYRAHDPTIGRLVAIKTIRLGELAQPEERQQLRDRLFREAQSAGILSHPGIVTIYDIAEEGNLAYIAMEFVDGRTLETILNTGAVSDAKYLVSLATQTAQALDYAHSKGIVHRDIKPGNIMVNSEARVKITDFGIARIASSKFTHTGTVMGTPSYMSPEQVRGAVVDGRSDLFSLAVVVYEMLTGLKPFTGDSITTIIFKIVSETPVPPKEINPSVGAKVDRVVMKALGKNPAERYQSCREFAEALEAAAAQTDNLTPTVRRMAALFAPTEVYDPAMATQADKKAEPPTVAPAEAPPTVPVAKEAKEEVEAPAPLAEPLEAPAVPFAGALTAPTVRPPQAKILPALEVRKEVKKPEKKAVEALPAAAAKAPAGRRIWLPVALFSLVVATGIGIYWQRRHSSAPAGPIAEVKAVPAPEAPPALPVVPPPAVPTPQVEKPAVERPALEEPEAPPVPIRRQPESQPAAETAVPTPKAGGPTINITTEQPGAQAVVDGKSEIACATPCSVPVSPGKHTVVLTRPGFHPERRDVQVKREPADISVAMRPILGTIMLSTAPPGATVTVDGKPVEGQTPMSLKLPPGRHLLTITKEGVGSAQQNVEVTDDALLPVRITLNPQ